MGFYLSCPPHPHSHHSRGVLLGPRPCRVSPLCATGSSHLWSARLHPHRDQAECVRVQHFRPLKLRATGFSLPCLPHTHSRHAQAAHAQSRRVHFSPLRATGSSFHRSSARLSLHHAQVIFGRHRVTI